MYLEGVVPKALPLAGNKLRFVPMRNSQKKNVNRNRTFSPPPPSHPALDSTYQREGFHNILMPFVIGNELSIRSGVGSVSLSPLLSPAQEILTGAVSGLTRELLG